MAKNLSAFMAQNAKKIENLKYVASDRFVGGDGTPVEWEIAAITAAENKKLRKSSTYTVKHKHGQHTQEFDSSAYEAKLAARCVVYPDLNDASLQESYGAMDAEELICAMLSSGEFAELVAVILDHNGFDTMGELTDKAKN